MRPFGIELPNESIEAFLLLQAVEARRPGRFRLEGEVLAFVPTVLLRMAGPDALDGICLPLLLFLRGVRFRLPSVSSVRLTKHARRPAWDALSFTN